jgi:hypothetical protein
MALEGSGLKARPRKAQGFQPGSPKTDCPPLLSL